MRLAPEEILHEEAALLHRFRFDQSQSLRPRLLRVVTFHGLRVRKFDIVNLRSRNRNYSPNLDTRQCVGKDSQALTTGTYAPKVRADFVSVRSGVNGTPTFFINGRRHDGTYLFQDLAAAIDAHLHAKV
jgi:hypothetical protein